MTDRVLTPSSVSAYCRYLATQRRELAKNPSANAALAVQIAKATMNEGARKLRASFVVLPGGKA